MRIASTVAAILISFAITLGTSLAQSQTLVHWRCDQAFNSKVVRSFDEKLKDLPGIREYLKAFINDPEVPEHLRDRMHFALSLDDISFVRLSEDFHENFLFSLRAEAMASLTPHNYRVDRLSGRETLNSSLSDPAQPTDKRKDFTPKKLHGIFVADRELTNKNNDFILLIHELSHVAFTRMFEERVRGMLGKFPDDLVSIDTLGRIHIDGVLYDYLNERYAHETELQAYMATHRRYYSSSVSKWSELNLRVPAPYLRLSIARFVVQSYELADPRLTDLNTRSLNDIIANGMKQN